MLRLLLAALLLAFAPACDSDDDPVRFLGPTAPGLAQSESDTTAAATAERLLDALDAAAPVGVVADVDHAANAEGAGLDLRPTRVVLFGNPALGTPLMQADQRAGLDLPQKMLVYEDADGVVRAAYNSTAYLGARHRVDTVATLDQIAGALANFAEAATGTAASRARPPSGISEGEGLVVAESDADTDATYARLRAAVEANESLRIVAELDHAANAESVGLELRPTRLLVFGNPALGTPLIQDSQTTAIDLPQKMLVYTDADGATFVVYNDPDYLAERHGLDMSNEELGQIATALATLADTATSDEED